MRRMYEFRPSTVIKTCDIVHDVVHFVSLDTRLIIVRAHIQYAQRVLRYGR